MRLAGIILVCLSLGALGAIAVLTVDGKLPAPQKKRYPVDAEIVSPLDAYLASVEGTVVLFFCTEHCEPCIARERDTVPWLKSNGWKVDKIQDADVADLFGIASYPLFVAVRNHRIVATSACSTRREAAAFLRAAKADTLDHVAIALAHHLNLKPPAGEPAAPIVSSSGRFYTPRPTPAVEEPLPLLGFPFGPSLSLLDVIGRYAGQEYAVNRFARVVIPKGIRWTPTRQKNCMHLEFQPPPVLRVFGKEVARCTAVDVSLDQVSLYLDGFPDFSIPILW